MLDLGPYHFKLKAHIQKLIDDLSLAIGPKMSYSAATLDGEPWHYQPFFTPSADLPYLKEFFVAFMTEAFVAWEWFTSEFDYGHGGLIDSPTAEEKELAWMSTTNEVNEGWLGGGNYLKDQI